MKICVLGIVLAIATIHHTTVAVPSVGCIRKCASPISSDTLSLLVPAVITGTPIPYMLTDKIDWSGNRMGTCGIVSYSVRQFMDGMNLAMTLKIQTMIPMYLMSTYRIQTGHNSNLFHIDDGQMEGINTPAHDNLDWPKEDYLSGVTLEAPRNTPLCIPPTKLPSEATYYSGKKR